MTTERDLYRFGARVKRGRTWFTCVSIPDGRGLHRWRDAQWRTIPELVDFRKEQRIVHGPPPPPPDDPLLGYTVVPALP